MFSASFVLSNIDLLAQVDAFLVDKSLPIWKSLSAERMELYRDIRTVTFGSSPHLERCAKSCTPLHCINSFATDLHVLLLYIFALEQGIRALPFTGTCESQPERIVSTKRGSASTALSAGLQALHLYMSFSVRVTGESSCPLAAFLFVSIRVSSVSNLEAINVHQ